MIWGALSDTKIGTLQKYQNRALALIESSKVKDAWNKDLMNINQLMTFDRAVMTYKTVNQLCPAGLQSGGCRGSPKTGKPPKYFRKTVKPSQDSGKTVFTLFHALHVPPRFCAVDECLVIIYMTSNHL